MTLSTALTQNSQHARVTSPSKVKNTPVKPFKKTEDKSAPHSAPSPMELATHNTFITKTDSCGPLTPISTSPLLALLETITCQLTLMETTGISETTLELNGSHFDGSPFQGSTLTIQEFSTAPKIFNVHLSGSLEATSLLQTHAAELIETVRKDPRCFAIHRVETSLLTKKRIVERKQEAGERNETT